LKDLSVNKELKNFGGYERKTPQTLNPGERGKEFVEEYLKTHSVKKASEKVGFSFATGMRTVSRLRDYIAQRVEDEGITAEWVLKILHDKALHAKNEVAAVAAATKLGEYLGMFAPKRGQVDEARTYNLTQLEMIQVMQKAIDEMKADQYKGFLEVKVENHEPASQSPQSVGGEPEIKI
jgi:phage terminase small subunit